MSENIVPVVTVEELVEIPGADKIVLAKFKEVSWQVIVSKAETKIGDILVYVPPDSVLPKALITKMGLTYIGNNGRVRSVKLRGVYSEGLTLPAPDGAKPHQNMADYFGITRYIEPVVQSHSKAGKRGFARKWNILVPHYDVEAGKNHPTVLQNNEVVVATEKIHGMNFQVGWVKKLELNLFERFAKEFLRKWFPLVEYEFVVCSKNLMYTHEQTDNTFSKISQIYGLKELLSSAVGYVFVGEIYGKNIQDLEYGLNNVRVVFYDVYDTNKREYLNYYMAKAIVEGFGLDFVPEIFVGRFNAENILAMAEGKTELGFDKDQIREGIVVKPIQERYSKELNDRAQVKFISKAYQARKGGTEHR